MFSTILPWILILPPLAYSLISLFCGRSYFGRSHAAADHTPSVTIIKPVKGRDAESYENFASFCRQDYPVHQIVFAVADAEDPAIPVIHRIMADFPDVDIELVIDRRIHGPNYKVCNLMNAWPKAKHDIVIVCDSDIRVVASFLREVCAPFSDPQVGLVTSLYRTSSVQGTASALEALGFTTEMVPNVMTALKLEGLSFALGASMAVRREAVEKIGGFAVLVDYLADDYQLGNQVFKAGYRLELSDCFVESVMRRERLSTVLSRQLRWARTMRVSRPGGYLASGITQPFPLALLAIVIAGFSVSGIAAAALLYAVRFSVALVYSRAFVRDNLLPRWLWLLPMRDALSFATWALSFLGDRVRWRGHLFRVLPGGKLKEI
ncbi:MAG: bacteriohopanetetrol glucosamine biosynthesis glycosyltransferase HpnI [Geobacter sp.]|nr:bacteriohopanetetrol glucosamine biosynthesis glycosyltransferase HpnI [Geobacter sp.]